MYDATNAVWTLVLIGTIGIPLTTAVVLYRGALAARLRRRTAATVAIAAVMALGGWFAISVILAETGVYADAAGEPAPWFGVAFIAVLTGLLLATAIPVIARSLAAPGSLVRLTLPHSLRLVGLAFLLVMADGGLPWLFAVPAGVGDMATGAAAPFVARRLARGEGHRPATWFNLLGLLDLAVALTIGFLAGIGPWQPFEIAPTTQALSVLPLALVPTVAVPVAITLHVVSLRQLRSESRTTARFGPARVIEQQPATVPHG